MGIQSKISHLAKSKELWLENSLKILVEVMACSIKQDEIERSEASESDTSHYKFKIQIQKKWGEKTKKRG